MTTQALKMVKIIATVRVPEGDYCDICTPERLEEQYQRDSYGDMKCVRNLVAGKWEYRCPFAFEYGGKGTCDLYNNTSLGKAQYIPHDPIAHRLLKCKNCRAASGLSDAHTGAESESIQMGGTANDHS